MSDPVQLPRGAPPEAAQPAPGALSLREKIEQALGNLVVLRATTVVGTVTAAGADELNQVTALALGRDGQEVASTSFNTLLGDGSVIVSPVFVTNPAYKALHDQTVAEARAIRAQSVQLLKELWAAFEPLLKDRIDRKPGS